MDRWVGKIALVTGASSGIGAATTKALLQAGLVVIGMARRVERVEKLKSELPATIQQHLHAIRGNVSNEEDILTAFKWIEAKFGGVDVLINSAGVFHYKLKMIDETNTAQLREIIDTNVLGLAMCSREAFNSMRKRAADGHVININSIAGHRSHYPGMNIYCASKFAVTAITETLRQEFKAENTKIKITSISPGAVRTEMLPKERLELGIAVLEAEDIADAVLYVLATPPRVQVHELTIQPVGQLT
ncbi:farnesol dehydrogenase-like [Wyeomyia smithii]|uniref:farnesol dehydrogenase-like n=1 Tax=Wyeomyia smithii TaxID=174621 RepID=UPI002467E686|nr:farnesol dehydrogenase-like [Wyeomyia smithii]